MRIIECEQGSPEWYAARAGIPTASAFNRILTAKTMKLSRQADGYALQLLAEAYLGTSEDDTETPWILRGQMLEGEAIRAYEFHRNVDVKRIGFAMHDTLDVGCSPDGLVGKDGGVEIKVPSPAVHLKYLAGIGLHEYRAQVQGCLWVAGRKWWDRVSYHPDLPLAVHRFERDEEFIDALSSAVCGFLARMEEFRDRLESAGCDLPASVVDNDFART